MNKLKIIPITLILLLITLPLTFANPWVMTSGGVWVNQAGKNMVLRMIPASGGRFIMSRGAAVGAEAVAGRAVASRGALRTLGVAGLVVGGAMMVASYDQQQRECSSFCNAYCEKEGKTYGTTYSLNYQVIGDSTCNCNCGRTLLEEKRDRTEKFAPYICRRDCGSGFRGYSSNCNSNGDCYVKCYDCKPHFWSSKKDKTFYIDPIRYNYAY